VSRSGNRLSIQRRGRLVNPIALLVQVPGITQVTGSPIPLTATARTKTVVIIKN